MYTCTMTRETNNTRKGEHKMKKKRIRVLEKIGNNPKIEKAIWESVTLDACEWWLKTFVERVNEDIMIYRGGNHLAIVVKETGLRLALIG